MAKDIKKTSTEEPAWMKQEHPGTFLSQAGRPGSGYVQLDNGIVTEKDAVMPTYLDWWQKPFTVSVEYPVERSAEVRRGARVKVTGGPTKHVFRVVLPEAPTVDEEPKEHATTTTT